MKTGVTKAQAALLMSIGESVLVDDICQALDIPSGLASSRILKAFNRGWLTRVEDEMSSPRIKYRYRLTDMGRIAIDAADDRPVDSETTVRRAIRTQPALQAVWL